MKSKILRFVKDAGFLFFITQLIAGGFNYLFQILAIQKQTPAEFGQWSEWLAKFSLILFLALWVQTFSILHDLSHFLNKVRIKIIFLTLIALFVVCLGLDQLIMATILNVLFSIVAAFFIGHLSRMQKFIWLSAGSIIGILIKFSWILIDSSNLSFYRSILMSSAVLAVFFVFGTQGSRHLNSLPEANTNKSLFNISKILLSLILAFFSVWIPQAEILIGGFFFKGELLGLFSAVSLLGKAYFFIFLIIAQILFAKDLQKKNHFLSPLFLGILLMTGLLMALAASEILPLFKSNLNWPKSWIYLNVFDTLVLCLVYRTMQTLSIAERTRQTLTLGLGSLTISMLSLRFNHSIEGFWTTNIFLQFIFVAYFIVKLFQNHRLQGHQK